MAALIDTTVARSILGDIPAEREADLVTYVAAASQVVEDLVGTLTPTEVTETFDGGASVLLLRNLDVTVTAVTIDGEVAVVDDDYTVDAVNGMVYPGTEACNGRFAAGTRTIVVTYTAGFDQIPDNYIQAAKEELRYLWQISEQGNRPSFGEAPDDTTQMSPAGFPVHPRVAELCGRRRRPKVYVGA